MSDRKTISRINLELPRTMKLELKLIAKNQGESVNTVIRSILRKDLNKILISDER